MREGAIKPRIVTTERDVTEHDQPFFEQQFVPHLPRTRLSKDRDYQVAPSKGLPGLREHRSIFTDFGEFVPSIQIRSVQDQKRTAARQSSLLSNDLRHGTCITGT